jgi:thiamine pyrophosphokinase
VDLFPYDNAVRFSCRPVVGRLDSCQDCHESGTQVVQLYTFVFDITSCTVGSKAIQNLKYPVKKENKAVERFRILHNERFRLSVNVTCPLPMRRALTLTVRYKDVDFYL